MREEDCRMSNPEHDELRDIHRRIDSLKEESERHYDDIREKLHGLEVAVAKGNRFPPAAWVAASAIVISIVGTGSVLYSKLETASSHSTKALSLIEKHVEAAPARFQRIEELYESYTNWRSLIPLCEQRVSHLEQQIKELEKKR